MSHENATRPPSESHSSLSSPNIEGLQTDDHDPNKVHLWIIGSSIIKDLKANLIYRQKNVKLTTLRDKTIYGARQLLKEKKILADNILFHIGSNDLEGKTAEDVMEDARLLVNETKELFPPCNIIVSEIQPRFYRDRRDSLYFEQKREKYNKFLSELCSEENIHLVQQDNLQYLDFSDGIHLSDSGIRNLVECYKRVTNPLLGIQANQNQMKPNFRANSHVSNNRDRYKYRQPWNSFKNDQDIHRSFDNSYQNHRGYNDEIAHNRYENYRFGRINRQNMYNYRRPSEKNINNIDLIEMLLNQMRR